MAYADVIDTSLPDGADDPAEADNNMRRIQGGFQEIINVEHDASLTGTEITGDGKHTDITPDSIVNAGSLVQMGDLIINTDKFTVDAATGNIVVAGKLDVAGNIDPTTFETTRGGFQNSDTMASAADNKVASSDSIVKYATLDAGGVLMHDAEGSFNNCDIDGTKTKVYTKYLTGTLDADSATSVAHGITGVDNILAVVVTVYNGTLNAYRVSEVYLAAAAATEGLAVRYDGTNVILSAVGSQYQIHKYRIKIDYKL